MVAKPATAHRPPGLSVREAAEILGVSPNTVRRLADRGELPHVRLGSQSPRRFREGDVALLARLSRRTAA